MTLAIHTGNGRTAEREGRGGPPLPQTLLSARAELSAQKLLLMKPLTRTDLLLILSSLFEAPARSACRRRTTIERLAHEVTSTPIQAIITDARAAAYPRPFCLARHEYGLAGNFKPRARAIMIDYRAPSNYSLSLKHNRPAGNRAEGKERAAVISRLLPSASQRHGPAMRANT